MALTPVSLLVAFGGGLLPLEKGMLDPLCSG